MAKLQIDTPNRIGIEIEVRGVAPDITALFCRNPMSVTLTTANDASIRSSTYTTNGCTILTRGLRGVDLTPISYGCEIQTSPMQDVVADLFIEAATNILEDAEEHTVDTSVHMHLDTKDWTYRRLYNLTRWWYCLEGITYRIASFGTIHRGVCNSFKYARPLAYPIGYTVHAPRSRTELQPIINTTALLHSTSFSQYLYNWGRMDYLWSRNRHYTPQRLHGLNITSLPRIGTIEFRVFNGHYSYLKQMKDVVRTFEYLSTQDVNPTTFSSGCPFFTPQNKIDPGLVREIFGDEFIELINVDLPQHLPLIEHHYSSYTHVTNEPFVPVENKLGATDTGDFDFLIST